MLQVIGSQSECVPRPNKRSHPREGAAKAKRTRRNNGQMDKEEEKETSATKKSSSETDMLWSEDDDDSDDDVPLFSVLQGRKTATARRKNPSGKRTTDRPGNTRVAVADSTTVDLSDSTAETVVDVPDTPTPTGSLLPPGGTRISTDSLWNFDNINNSFTLLGTDLGMDSGSDFKPYGCIVLCRSLHRL